MDRTGNKYHPITESVHYLPAKAFPCLQNHGGQEIAPSLAGLELTNYGILARQGAPAIPVSQPPQHWNYMHIAPFSMKKPGMR